ncbi:MAG: NmrA/HSCARG family protein [Thermoplasmata archaeon]
MNESVGPIPRPAAKSLRILVTGVRGQQGGHVARHLLSRGHRVRGLARKSDDPAFKELRSRGVEIVEGGFDDPAVIERSAREVDGMFLMGTSFEGGPETEKRQGIRAVDAAKAAGVPWLVYSSVSDANHHTGIPHFESKYAVEQHLGNSGMAYAISAPTSFMENFRASFQLPSLRQGKLAAGVSPERPVQMVALDDLATFVTHILENPTHFKGKRINVASDELNETDVARTITELSGRKIEYQQIPAEILRAQNADLAKMYEWFERGGYTADIEGLRREYPGVGWQRFREWASHQDFARLLAT